MKPVTDPVVRYTASNSLLLAVLGCIRLGESVEAALPAAAEPVATEKRLVQAALPHDLDLALLGLVRLSDRLGALVANSSDSDGTQTNRPANLPVDLLR